MRTVCIIAEYNPFHNGHLYQIKKIREEFGEDTQIVAVMSGNCVQRADVAVMDKWARAKSAVENGINLVLELPFPYSSSSAELFARAAVKIASSINIVDTLSFGSELGAIDELTAIAERISSEELQAELSRLVVLPENAGIGFPALVDKAYTSLYGKNKSLAESNNILAVEYIRAIKESACGITPHTIKRSGANYNEKNIVDARFQSATSIRESILRCDNSALEYIPEAAKNIILSQIERGKAPCSSASIFPFITAHFLLNKEPNINTHDIDFGLFMRIKNKCGEAAELESLIHSVSTKKYTTARIRRAIWFSLFGVTSSDIKEPPHFTQVLAMDKIGQTMLKKIKKTSDFNVLTRPSVKMKSPLMQRQKKLADSADMIFQLTRPTPDAPNAIYRQSPFVLQ